jgi:hypothetical protein
MAALRTPQSELPLEVLDRELIAKGAQIPEEELFKFEDSEGTPARDAIMARVKELYNAAPSPNPALSGIDTWRLANILIHKTRETGKNRMRGIWNKDYRMDYFGIADEQAKKNADCTAAIMFKDSLDDEKNGVSTLKTKNYGKVFNLWDEEPFRDQPIAAGKVCTGFLVKDDVIATAAHFVNERNVTGLYIVFGFRMSDPSTPLIRMSANENIYKGVKIIHRVLNRTGNKSDWALVKLDRKVVDHPVATLSRKRIFCDQPVYVIGHPVGLPLKYAPGGHILDIDEAFFSADLDVFMGNSGSPVFSSDTHEVIGMVVRGDTMDFRWTGKGWATVIYTSSDIKSSCPQCTRVSEFIDVVNGLQ